MNKNRHRLIFNPARNQLIAVSEIAVSRSRVTGTAAGPALSAQPSSPISATLHPLAFSLLVALGMGLTLSLPAHAQVVADPSAPGNQQASVTQATNGVPLINIQTPSTAGVSRNVFSQFDVDSQGVILNNAVTNVSTQLGGWIQGNPYLAGGSARVILNEVNSASPSQLLGYIEVGGSRAQVVIANPAGITCDGCGFINASRATLTTGTPILNGGSLDGYRVQRGQITVQGAGLDASQTDYTDLIARAVQINAGIWAQQLAVTVGTNQVDAANTLATPIPGSGTAPTVSIDVAELGGMYAHKITLVGTEAGVGVRNAGQIGASVGDVIITADGHLLNSGLIASAASIDITSGGLSNSGTLIAQNHAVLNSTADMSNMGVLAAGGNLSASAQTIDNRALLNAGGTLDIQADTLDNRNTPGADQGIQAGAVSIHANRIDNASGTISADGALTVTSSGTLDNTQGFMAAGDTLALLDADPTGRTLAITNTAGTFIAGRLLQVDTAGLSGDGSLLSLGDLDVHLISDYLHSGELVATGNAVFETAGTLTNQAQILAGNLLAISADGIDNTASGEFSAAATTLSATGLLTNRGLIDGGETLVTAGTLDNLGTGRIFGDHLAIAATTLNNTSENGVGAVIAARDRLDIGVQTLANQDKALVFSAGDLAIGGALDANRHATGQATLIINMGATIEALGTFTINALELRNLNANLVTQQVNDPKTYEERVQPAGSATSYPVSDCWGIGGGQDANVCSGYPGIFEDYTWFKITSSPSHTEVVSTQPSQLLSGGDMLLTGGSILNQDSHIVAGGLLDLGGASVTNQATQGQDVTSHSGTAQFTYVESCGTFGDRHCRRWGPITAYNPAPAYGTPYNLPTTQLAQNTVAAGSGTTLPDTSGPTVIGAIAPATLPSNTLFQPTPNPMAGYLIETDPRFADYRTWLSSDYLLGQLEMDPAFMQKRLGDGFYEQRLIREQVAQLTGRRFLDGYANDEAQYRALMNAGLTYAQEWNLIPGVALTATQIAQLTSDIVWLVAQEVTLPDGRRETALVPQVYVRVQPGDVDGSGSLLSGQIVNVNVSGDVVNSGTLAGRQLVRIDAANIRNLGGRITGSDVALLAQQDIDNLGGTIDASDRLTAIAGRDINVVTTTRDSENTVGSSSFTRTAVERVAGLYVSGPAGELLASAGRDVTLTAAVIANSGAGVTQINAGNDMNLTTVATGRQDNVVWNDQNHLNQGSTLEVGTAIQTQGDAILTAGRDLTARAAQVNSADGTVQASAGRDLRIESGESSENWSEARHITSDDFLSKKTSTNLDSLADTRAVASNFSGKSVSLTANNDIAVHGSTLSAQDGIAVVAGGDIALTAAENTHDTSHYSYSKKSGVTTSGYSKRSAEETATQSDITHTGSTLHSEQGNIILAANLAANADPSKGLVLVEGSTVRADTGSVAISGKHILVTASEDRSVSERTLNESKSTVAFSTGVPGGKKHALDASESRSTLNGSIIEGAAGVSLAAQGVIDITASHLAAQQGDIAIRGAEVSIRSGLNSVVGDVTETTKKTGVDIGDLTGIFKPGEGAGFKSTLTTENAHTTLALATLDAQNITIQSTAGDITLTAIEATARGQNAENGEPQAGTISLDAARDLNLATLATTDYQSSDLEKGDYAWQSVKGDGSQDETTHYNRLNAGELNVSAGNRITADMSVEDSAALLAQEAGMEWLKQLQDDPALADKVDWKSIQEAHQNWDYKHQGLTPAAAAVVAIVVAYFTAGAGAAIVEGAATAGATATAAAAGTTVAATYATTTAVVQAAVATLASKAAVSLINNGGHVDETLKELGSEENLRQLAVALVTAGVLSEVGQINFGTEAKPVTLNKVDANDFTANVGKNLVNGLTRATITSAVTGTDLETSIRTEVVAGLLNAASAEGADWVGDQAAEGGFFNHAGQVNEFGRAFAHAVVGCAAGAAGASASGSNIGTGSGCTAGALGAVVGELSAQFYGADDRAKTIAFASMMSGMAAAAAGLDSEGVAIAASTGANAAENNYLNHNRPSLAHLSEKERYEADSASCAQGDNAACTRRDELVASSRERDRELAQACAGGSPDLCRTIKNEAIDMGNRVFVTPSGFTYANSPDAAFRLNTATIGPPPDPRKGTFQDSVSHSTAEAAILASTGAGVRALGGAWTAASTPSKMAVGAGAGGGFDAAGQLYQGEEYRPWQTLVAGTTGALAGPLATTSVWGNALLGGAVGATNTSVTNSIYDGLDQSVFDAALNGALFSGAGTYAAPFATTAAKRLLPPFVGGNPINPAIPLLFQNFGKPNPYPAPIGTTVEQGISSIPSFVDIPWSGNSAEGSKP
jgi:filamentous hemagglutinin